MLKDKVKGMCSKLLEGVKDKLDSLKVKAFGYPDFII
jgi:hypothetical protein